MQRGEHRRACQFLFMRLCLVGSTVLNLVGNCPAFVREAVRAVERGCSGATRRPRAASCPCHPTRDSRAPRKAASGRVRQAVPGRPPAARVAYLDLAAAPPRLELGLADVGPAACLAGELSLLPGILASPAQAHTAPGRSWDAACHGRHACMLFIFKRVVRCCTTRTMLPSSSWRSRERGNRAGMQGLA
jgi:hypothetical protein